MADDTRNGRLAASLSILCAVAATLMPTASQMVYARSAPDSNAYFGVLLLMPALYLAGLGLAFMARRRLGAGDRLARVALWLNAGMLLATIAFAIWGVFAYRAI